MTVSPARFVDRLRRATPPIHRDRALLGAARLLEGAEALELGGPSALFARRGLVPVYTRLAVLDTLDYAEHTIWSGAVDFEIEPRRHLIGEARELRGLSDSSYDAVLASHVLEHIADPIGALAEWRRVVRPAGHILLVMPHLDGTFDHRRPVTSLAHLREDAARETAEDDMTHLEEVLTLHDLARDPGAPSREVFERRCRENTATRAMHHHVFASRTVAELCEEAGLEVLLLRPKLPHDVVCLCRRSAGPSTGIDQRELAGILKRSPFPSDRG